MTAWSVPLERQMPTTTATPPALTAATENRRPTWLARTLRRAQPLAEYARKGSIRRTWALTSAARVARGSTHRCWECSTRASHVPRERSRLPTGSRVSCARSARPILILIRPPPAKAAQLVQRLSARASQRARSALLGSTMTTVHLAPLARPVGPGTTLRPVELELLRRLSEHSLSETQ